MQRVICLLIGYAFGLFQTGYIYGRSKNVDIRELGSKNAGTTNALRTMGVKAGILTLLGDVFKCVLAAVIVRLIYADSPIRLLLVGYAGLGVILGHNFPFYLKFRGGKGIAAGAGLMLALNPVMFLIALAVFVVLLLTTKYVSLGSLAMMLVFAVEVIVYGQMGGLSLKGGPLYEFYAIIIFLTILAFIRHRTNIKRLISGTESKTDLTKYLKKDKPGAKRDNPDTKEN